VIYFMCAYEDRTLKSTKIILSRRWKKENHGRDEPNEDTL
jgi:hypothetical protein